GDFNRDGKLDIVMANTTDHTVGVLLGNGDGTFQTVATYYAAARPAAIAVGDFNGDGFPDLAVANSIVPGTTTVVLNAADWGTGHAAAPPGSSGLPPASSSFVPVGLPSSLLVASQPQTSSAMPLTPTDFWLHSVMQWPSDLPLGYSWQEGTVSA